MKTKLLAVLFLIIVFAVCIANIPNAYRAISGSTGADGLRGVIDSIDNTYNDSFIPKYRFVEVNGISEKALQKEIINETVILNNGYLSYKFGKKDVTDKAVKVDALRDYLESKDIKFFYEALPYKNSPYDNQVPFGLYDYGNENQMNMTTELANRGVKILDMVSAMNEYTDGDWYSAYFKTDHHWKPETAFWAYTKTAQYLHDEYGYELDEQSMDFDNYNKDVYKDWFLGSQGKKTGRYVAGLDDISIIYPKWDTKMSVTIPTEGIVREGTYREAVFDERCLEKDYYNISTYTAYLGNMLDLCEQRNPSAVNHAKVLVIKDSFAIAMTPYLSFMFDEVDVIDLRYYEKGTLKEYIDKTSPDVVIMPYSSSVFGSKGVFDYGL